MVAYRVARFLYLHHLRRLARACSLLGRVITGATVPASAEIGPGTRLAYGGSGVVIHARARIGAKCQISPGVVVGGRSGSVGVPRIGDGVMIYANAQVLGDISIGDGATIGPAAIVIEDVPPGAVMVAPLAKRLR